MNRREALRLLAAGAGSQLTSAHLFALRQARALVGTQVQRRTLDAHQHATVTAIADLIIPRTDTPGAADVGASDFIDLILTEWYNDEDRAGFLAGLDDVDANTKALFGKPLIECSTSQQAEILTGLGDRMVEDENVRLKRFSESTDSRPTPHQNFYLMLRHLTLTAYYTSEAGAEAELHFQVIPDRYDGCADLSAGKEAPKPQ
jgi:glucoside 3-dehydrogenase (cytochrome c) hitch-hiker subunit